MHHLKVVLHKTALNLFPPINQQPHDWQLEIWETGEDGRKAVHRKDSNKYMCHAKYDSELAGY